MSEEFFSKIGNMIAQQAVQRSNAANQSQHVRTFQGDVIKRVASIAKRYVAGLEQQGVRAEFEQNALGLSFTMRWEDGGHWTLILGPSHDANGLQFYEDFTSDDGRNSRTTDASSFTSATWKDDLFEQRLQKAVERYVFYADRHGGVR